MLDHRAGDHVPEPLTAQLEPVHHGAKRLGEHLLVANRSVSSVRARKGKADYTNDCHAPDSAADEHSVTPCLSWGECEPEAVLLIMQEREAGSRFGRVGCHARRAEAIYSTGRSTVACRHRELAIVVFFL